MPNVPLAGPLGHQKSSTVSRRPKIAHADTKPQARVSVHRRGRFRARKADFDVPYTMGPVFVHGRLNRRDSGAKRQGLQARKAASAASPSPRRGVWGEGNVKKKVLPGRTKQKGVTKKSS